jgi:hypothetical protein
MGQAAPQVPELECCPGVSTLKTAKELTNFEGLMDTAADIGMIIHGIRLPITAQDVSPIIWHALESGKYEAKEARQVQRLLRSGDRVLELGSGIGVVTVVMV